MAPGRSAQDRRRVAYDVNQILGESPITRGARNGCHIRWRNESLSLKWPARLVARVSLAIAWARDEIALMLDVLRGGICYPGEQYMQTGINREK